MIPEATASLSPRVKHNFTASALLEHLVRTDGVSEGHHALHDARFADQTEHISPPRKETGSGAKQSAHAAPPEFEGRVEIVKLATGKRDRRRLMHATGGKYSRRSEEGERQGQRRRGADDLENDEIEL